MNYSHNSQDILDRLKSIYHFKVSSDRTYLQEGICPQCKKKELFTSYERPLYLRCNRINKCGFEAHTKTLHPELFEQYTKRFPRSEQNPNAAADAYMSQARGLNINKMRAYYTQEYFYDAKSGQGSATVRFRLTETDTYMERFVDTLSMDGAKRKQNIKGSYAGYWWQAPDMAIEQGDSIWIVEGIIDAISLWHCGIKAVACLSCTNLPRLMIEKYRLFEITWVIALDNDAAGQKYTKQYVRELWDKGFKASAAQSSLSSKSKEDWNDLYLKRRLKPDDIEDYRLYGRILMAKNALEKGALIYSKWKKAENLIDFANRWYWFKLEINEFANILSCIPEEQKQKDLREAEFFAAMEAGKVKEIANVRPEFLYFERDEVRDETAFYVRVHFPDTRPAMNISFSNSQIYTSSEFGKNLVKAHGAWWSGEQRHLNYIGHHFLQGLKEVKRIDYLGYVKEFDAYLFPNVSVQSGVMVAMNEEDYFALKKVQLKSSLQVRGCEIQTTNEHYRQDWALLIYQAFGAQGLVAAVFWFGSLFAEQIRAVQSSFPFLEIIGEPGAGKTTLIEFLWKLYGRNDEEGFDPNKWSSVGNWRKLAQWSNMPTVFIEADREESSHQKRFDWESIKAFYNGRGLRGTGQKSNDNNTHEADFRGTLVIAQNNPVDASDAVLERIIQLNFKKSGHSFESKKVTDAMNLLSAEVLSYFLILATKEAASIVSYVNQKTAEYQSFLLGQEEVNHARLAKNHAQLMALADELARIVGLPPALLQEVHETLKALCLERQKAVQADHPMVAEFWSLYEFLNDGLNEHGAYKPVLNHSMYDEYIAINLNEFVEQANLRKQQIPPLMELKRLLKTSKTYTFIDASKTLKSAIRSRNGVAQSVRCWVFKNNKRHY